MGVPKRSWDRCDGVGTAGLKGKGALSGAGTADLGGEVLDRGRASGSGPGAQRKGLLSVPWPCVAREVREPGSGSLHRASWDSRQSREEGTVLLEVIFSRSLQSAELPKGSV